MASMLRATRPRQTASSPVSPIPRAIPAMRPETPTSSSRNSPVPPSTTPLKATIAGNSLEGGAGNDRLIGAPAIGSTDEIDGGDGRRYCCPGREPCRLYDHVRCREQTFALTSSSGVVTRVKNVETLQFADGTLSVASLIAGDDNDNTLSGTETRMTSVAQAATTRLRALAVTTASTAAPATTPERGRRQRQSARQRGERHAPRRNGHQHAQRRGRRDAASYAQAAAAVRVDLRIAARRPPAVAGPIRWWTSRISSARPSTIR